MNFFSRLSCLFGLKSLGLLLVSSLLMIPSSVKADATLEKTYVMIRNGGDTEIKNYPVTFGVLFDRGLTDGKPAVLFQREGSEERTEIRTQPTKVNYHDDGSARLVRFSCLIPEMDPDETVRFYFEDRKGQYHGRNQRPTVTVPNHDLEVRLEVTDENGKTWTFGDIPGKLVKKYAQGDATALCPDFSGGFHRRISLEGPLLKGRKQHPELRARIEWDLYDAKEGEDNFCRIRMTLENTNPWSEDYIPENYENLDIQVWYKDKDGNDVKGESYQDITVSFQTWAVIAEKHGGSMTPVHLVKRQNGESMVKSGYLTPINYSHMLSDKEAEDYCERFYEDNRLNPEINVYGMPFCHNTPEGKGIFDAANFSQTGDHATITDGNETEIAIVAWNSTNPKMDLVNKALDYNSLGQVPIHVRQEVAGYPVPVYGIPWYEGGGRYKDKRSGCSGITPDHSHMCAGAARVSTIHDPLADRNIQATTAFASHLFYKRGEDGLFQTGKENFPNRKYHNVSKLLDDGRTHLKHRHKLQLYADDMLKTNLEYLASLIPGKQDDQVHLFPKHIGDASPSSRWNSPFSTITSPWQAYRVLGLYCLIYNHSGDENAKKIVDYMWDNYAGKAVRDIGTSYTDAEGNEIVWTKADIGLIFRYSLPLYQYLHDIENTDKWDHIEGTEIPMNTWARCKADIIKYDDWSWNSNGDEPWHYHTYHPEQVGYAYGYREPEPTTEGWLEYGARFALAAAADSGLDHADTLVREHLIPAYDARETPQGRRLIPASLQGDD